MSSKDGETPRKTVAQVAKEWGEKPINKYIDTELVDPVFAKGYTQGLEDAAKVCDAHAETWKQIYWVGVIQRNAEAIRALKKEGK